VATCVFVRDRVGGGWDDVERGRVVGGVAVYRVGWWWAGGNVIASTLEVHDRGRWESGLVFGKRRRIGNRLGLPPTRGDRPGHCWGRWAMTGGLDVGVKRRVRVGPLALRCRLAAGPCPARARLEPSRLGRGEIPLFEESETRASRWRAFVCPLRSASMFGADQATLRPVARGVVERPHP